MSDYSTYTFPNGLRLIFRQMESPVVYCGYQIAAGSRHEQAGEEGLAHFCEHMTFKGTERHHALQIINGLEQVGGELNAFTNKEDTTFYAVIQKEHIQKAINLLSEIVFSSTYPQHEIDKEVEVICDEIESYNDTPAELIYDEFENIIFEGHPLGHNILGETEYLRAYRTTDAQRFTQRYYRPDNAIFFVYGDVDFKHIVRLLNRQLPMMESVIQDHQQTPVSKCNSCPESSPQEIILHKGTHQAHVMIGSRAYSIHDERRMPLYLLNNLLGGPGMNARLNLVLRERCGLVYTVESTMVSYEDTGIWSVYFGCDPHDIRRCRRLVRRELDRLMQRALSPSQLTAAKRQIKGQLAIACDNHEQFALDFGKSYLHYGWERDVTHLFAQIEGVTAQQIQQVAQEIFAPERLTTLIYQ